MSPKVKIPEGEDYSWFQAAVRGSLGLMSPSGSDLPLRQEIRKQRITAGQTVDVSPDLAEFLIRSGAQPAEDQ